MYGVVELNSDALGSTRFVLKNGNSGTSLGFKSVTCKPFGVLMMASGSDKVTCAGEMVGL